MIIFFKTIVYFVKVLVIAVPLCTIANIFMLINADRLALKLYTLALTMLMKGCIFAE